MLENLFDGTAVRVTEAVSDSDAISNLVILESEGGFAVSMLARLRDNLLLVNSALYITGAR